MHVNEINSIDEAFSMIIIYDVLQEETIDLP